LAEISVQAEDHNNRLKSAECTRLTLSSRGKDCHAAKQLFSSVPNARSYGSLRTSQR
jgi:hypothetical protein